MVALNMTSTHVALQLPDVHLDRHVSNSPLYSSLHAVDRTASEECLQPRKITLQAR